MVSELLLISARWYARHGMAVFPLHYPVERDGILWCSCGSSHIKQDGTPDGNPAKHPYAMRAKRGLLDATTDLRQVEKWWCAGTPYNIGLRTGRESGIVVIDVDPRHGGDDTLTSLEERYGCLPETRRHITGSLGQHIFFRHPGLAIRNNVAKLGAGLDVRGDGGYVVAPPSRHISGERYAAVTDDDVELAAMPAWLLGMLNCETDHPKAATMPPELAQAGGRRCGRRTPQRRGGPTGRAPFPCLLADFPGWHAIVRKRLKE
jgi:hypothetical protein